MGVVVVIVGLTFGFLGGEYSTLDWWQLRNRVRTEEELVERLRRETDSLTRAADALETDSATIERAAREDLGMLRDGEILFRVERPRLDPDSGGLVR